jgi:hypothetical protein
MKKNRVILICLLVIVCCSCKKKKETESSTTTATSIGPNLIFKFQFDSTQVRLNNLGQPSGVVSGHGAQSPVFQIISSHYIELAPSDSTLLGNGAVLYRAPETSLGGSLAIDFDSSVLAQQGGVFFSIPLKNVAAGSYKWLRVSLAYQNYDIKYKVTIAGIDYYYTGRLASFIGFNTYIRTYKINTMSKTLDSNKVQGYWGFESLGTIYTGQAPAGGTTVPNPIASTSPIPAGSCVVTGQFPTNLTITGKETNDITVIVSLSTNKSFEWIDSNGNGWYEPLLGEQVTDMGIRGLIPSIQ